MSAYYSDDAVTLYLGDFREVLPCLGVSADLVVADPPYGETSLPWDIWPDGWLADVAQVSQSLWCFGTMRLLGERWQEFSAAGWKFSQDVIWEKNNGSGFARDRFRRVHEAATHWYRGPWRDIHHEAPRVSYSGPDKTAHGRGSVTPHTGKIGTHTYTDDGTRITRSVVKAAAVRYQRRHPMEKPTTLLVPLIKYACPPGGLVIDPFAGSGSTLDAARQLGCRAIGIERHEPYAEKAAERLASERQGSAA